MSPAGVEKGTTAAPLVCSIIASILPDHLNFLRESIDSTIILIDLMIYIIMLRNSLDGVTIVQVRVIIRIVHTISNDFFLIALNDV
jgi:hypothetical protein